MIEHNVKVVIILESPISKTFLFECSKYWASDGSHVHYISKKPQDKLPPFLENNRTENQIYAEFMQITFLTAPSIKDFIEYMLNLRKTIQVPKALIVENMESYIEDSLESEYLLMCSLLKSTARFCSQILGSACYVIVSSKSQADRLNKINLILTPSKIWQTHENYNNGITNYILREIPLNPLCDTVKELHFVLLEKDDGSHLRLRNVTNLLEESCNFNSLVLF